ncbi:hypothetical protein AC804_07450 [Chryseobacterium sp. Hurlbut01]|nr:hypothetical protein AC804_07450 [Chryseobacterium sp. Hurlbut01]
MEIFSICAEEIKQKGKSFSMILFLGIRLFRCPDALIEILINKDTDTFFKIYLYVKTSFEVRVSDKLSKKAKG